MSQLRMGLVWSSGSSLELGVWSKVRGWDLGRNQKSGLGSRVRVEVESCLNFEVGFTSKSGSRVSSQIQESSPIS